MSETTLEVKLFTRILSGGAVTEISDEMILAEFDALIAPVIGVAGVAAASVIVLLDIDSSEMVGTEGR